LDFVSGLVPSGGLTGLCDCPAGTGRRLLSAARCAEYVPKFCAGHSSGASGERGAASRDKLLRPGRQLAVQAFQAADRVDTGELQGRVKA